MNKVSKSAGVGAFLAALVFGSPSDFTIGGSLTVSGSTTYYAEGYIDGGSQTVAIAAAGQNVWVEVDGCTSGELNGFTQSACDFTVTNVGTYLITYSTSFSGGASKVYETGISIDDSIESGCRTRRKLGAGGDVGNTGGTCIITLASSEVVKPEMRGTDSTTVDATVSDLTFTIHQL